MSGPIPEPGVSTYRGGGAQRRGLCRFGICEGPSSRHGGVSLLRVMTVFIMKLFFRFLASWVGLVSGPGRAVVGAAEVAAQRFSQSVTTEDKQRLGLAQLSTEQWADLDRAVAAFQRGETGMAVERALQAMTQKTAERVETAEKKVQVAEQEIAAEAAAARATPGLKPAAPSGLARAREVFKKKTTEAPAGRFTAKIAGPFHGWSGGTYFPLENGQVWKQTGTESSEWPLVAAAEVAIYPSGNGYWRLSYQGEWITVKRVQ